MKRLQRVAVVAVLAGVLFSFVSLAPVSADTQLTDDQQTHIRDNCSQIKNTLNQLHVSDTLLRVNRGQFYESMSSKLMERFNTRLSNNSIDNNAFVTITDGYGVTLNAFRVDYQAYEQQLSNTIAIDCTKRPVTFYSAVNNSRDLRHKVHDDITKLNQQIGDYQTALGSFADSYSKVSGGQQ